MLFIPSQHLSSENETLRECILEQQNVTELAHVDHQSELNHAQTEFEDRTKQVREDLADADEQVCVMGVLYNEESLSQIFV